MAKIHGHGGVLKVGGVDVGHLQGWNLDVQANVTEGSSMGDQWADNEATIKKWSGSAEVYFDPADAGQNALDLGDVAALSFYPGGDAIGASYRSGTAVVTGIPLSGSKDGWVAMTVNFAGKGPLTVSTVS